MQLNELTAISPIDGRYRSKTESLAPFFSEEALIKYRVLVEIEYFIALCEQGVPQLAMVSTSVFPKLRAIYENFSTEDALWIKDTEKTTNHDVKAVEYFVKKEFDKLDEEIKNEYEQKSVIVQEMIMEVIGQIKIIERASDKKISEWQSNVALLTVNVHINYLKSKYKRNKNRSIWRRFN